MISGCPNPDGQQGSGRVPPPGQQDAGSEEAQPESVSQGSTCPPETAPSAASSVAVRFTSAAASSGACCSVPSDCILATKVRYALDGTPLPPPSRSSGKGVGAAPEQLWLVRVLVLVMLMLLNTINFWDRNLLYNLSATETPGCDEVCADAVEVPTCLECSDVLGLTTTSSIGWDQCDACRLCRISAHSDYYNMKDGACLSSWQYSVLSGFGFTLSFAIVGVFAGYLADRFDRRVVHTAAIMVWSLATIGSGMCDGFLPLLGCRVLLGLGQAFNAPCCYALLTAHFQEGGRPLANGIYSMGTYLGAGLSSLSILLALAVGWRDACYLAGSVGLALAVLYSLVITHAHQPPSHGKATSGSSSSTPAEKPHGGRAVVVTTSSVDVLEEVSEVLSSRAMLLLCLASSLRMVGTTTMAAYLPVLVQRAFLPHVEQFSLLNAFGYSVCGSLSSSFGGLAAGFLAQHRRGPAALAMLPALGVAAAVVPLAVTVLSPSFWVAMVTLLLQYLLAECWLGPGMAVLQRQLRPQVHGMAVAVLLLCNNLLCNLGPAAVGLVDDGSAPTLKAAFLSVMLCSYTGSSIVFALLGAHLHHHQHQPPAEQQRGTAHSPAAGTWEGTLEAGGGRRGGSRGGGCCARSCCGQQQRREQQQEAEEREPLLLAPTTEAGGNGGQTVTSVTL